MSCTLAVRIVCPNFICILGEYTKYIDEQTKFYTTYFHIPHSTKLLFTFLLYFISRSLFPQTCTQVQDLQSYTNHVSLVDYQARSFLTQLTNLTSSLFLALKKALLFWWFWVDEKWLLLVVTVGLGFPFPRSQLLSPLAVISRSELGTQVLLSYQELSEPGQLMGIKSRAKKSQVGATVMY